MLFGRAASYHVFDWQFTVLSSKDTNMCARRLLAALPFMALVIVGPNNTFAADHPAQYAVGVAAVDITPSYPVRLNGFGFRRGESEGVTRPIWAKALAIGTDSEKPLVLVAIDSLGIRLPMVEEVARRLKEKAGIEPERLAVTFTHSHTTPKVNGASDTIFSSPLLPDEQKHVDQYTADLTDWIEDVALAALADRKPARLEWAVGKVGFAINRRTPGGPVDHDLPMLVVRTAADDAIRAIYVSYACHCVTLSNNKISGDWAGFAQAAIERAHPGAIALMSVGCGSDSNPSSGVAGDNVAVCAEQGDEIAKEVERLLKGELKPITGRTGATLAHIELPLQPLPDRAALTTMAAKNDANSYNAQWQLAKLDRGEELLSAIDYPIQVWTFGDSLTMVFLAGEVCVDYSLRLKKELDASHLWLNGYANDFCCYIPSERLLQEGGYGGGGEINYFALPATLSPGMEEKIIAEVQRQVPTRFHREESAVESDAATAIAKLVDGLAVGTPAEYERIPEIWRQALEAGKRNQDVELQRVLELSLPALEKPAEDWQVVVIGGGIINGLSMSGVWPRHRITQLIQGNESLNRRWQHLIDLSTKMADDKQVRSGTRYDALRILGAAEFDKSGAQLAKYLNDKDDELQMGAVSGLSDIESPAAAEAIAASLGKLNEHNRRLAIDALQRTDSRMSLLQRALDDGVVKPSALTPEQLKRMKEIGSKRDK
jgi:hypothetical protein